MHHTIFTKISHLWRTIYKLHILFQPWGLGHKLLSTFVFSLNHSLGEKACVWRRQSEIVLKVFNFFVGLRSSWINFATYNVPDIKVEYNMLIRGRKLGNTYKPRKSYIDKSSNWFLTDCDCRLQPRDEFKKKIYSTFTINQVNWTHPITLKTKVKMM